MYQYIYNNPNFPQLNVNYITDAIKNCTMAHYEIMCAIKQEPFRTYQEGFPLKLISDIKDISNRDVIGNISSDGVEIINELGEMHMKTGALIVLERDIKLSNVLLLSGGGNLYNMHMDMDGNKK